VNIFKNLNSYYLHQGSGEIFALHPFSLCGALIQERPFYDFRHCREKAFKI